MDVFEVDAVGGNIGEEGLEEGVEDVFSVDGGGGGEVIPTRSDDPNENLVKDEEIYLSNVPRTSMLLDDIDPSGLWGCGGVVGGVVKGIDDSSSNAGLGIRIFRRHAITIHDYDEVAPKVCLLDPMNVIWVAEITSKYSEKISPEIKFKHIGGPEK
ncbi:hypothetical protein BT96DRAFT_947538, partial [Gymnopus androsaceus JB14]